MRIRTIGLTIWAFLAVAPAAWAVGLPAQTFAPSPHPRDYFTVQGTETLPHLGWGVGAFFNYAQDPLLLRGNDGSLHREVVSDQLTANVLVSFGLFDFMELAVDLPVHLYMAGEGLRDNAEPTTAGIGDLRIIPRFRILDHGGKGFGLAAAAIVTVPTGKAIDPFMGAENATVTPQLMAEVKWGLFRLAADLGYRFAEEANAKDLQVDDELVYGLGVGVKPGTEKVEIVAEAFGAAGANSLFEKNERRLEVDAGLKIFPVRGLTVNVGGGAGVLSGYGTPQWRVFAGLGYSPIPEPDTDGDGLVDSLDQCPTDPEDKDGFEDGNGCPDPDNDQDGILDASDTCPNEPEDKDGFEDGDGCPDPDNDQDGILDVDDRCPNEPEDKDGFEDGNGCPDPDNDNDRILDVADQCPLQPENYNGCKDDDGCPEEGRICMTATKIVTLEPIYFVFGKAVILERSFPVLEEMAKALAENPQILKVRVEGHTDDIGRDPANLKLSKARAKSVYDALIKRGIAKKRLLHEGYGETRPLVPNTSDENRQQNRRVDFIIVETAPSAPVVPPAPAPPAAPEAPATPEAP